MKFTKTHEWVKQNKNVAVIGISNHAQAELSDIVYVHLPVVGTEFKKGDVMLSVESVKAASDIYAPISGKIIEVNGVLESVPEKVNQSPENEGWLVKMEIADPKELENLLEQTSYLHSLNDE